MSRVVKSKRPVTRIFKDYKKYLSKAKGYIRDLTNTVQRIIGLTEELQSVGDDAQLANIDLQNILQQQQQAMQMMTQISKDLNETSMAVIRE